MDTQTLQDHIRIKLEKDFQPTYLQLIDETDRHKKHKQFQKDKFHYRLCIESETLSNQSKLKAHQAIYNTLGDLMQTHIHALSIEIKKATS